jgi:phosphatidylethanolamine-binding protein (PEBP) family uncharacterized protein
MRLTIRPRGERHGTCIGGPARRHSDPPRRRGTVALGAAVVGVALSGCGTAAPAVAPLSQIQFASPVLTATHILPARYACNPRVGLPPLQWGAVPAKTASMAIVVYVVSASGSQVRLLPHAAVAGLSPTLHKLTSGKLPHGAVIGRNSFVVCPTKGLNVKFVVRLFALSKPIDVSHGFDTRSVLGALAPSTIAVGAFTFQYRRA